MSFWIWKVLSPSPKFFTFSTNISNWLLLVPVQWKDWVQVCLTSKQTSLEFLVKKRDAFRTLSNSKTSFYKYLTAFSFYSPWNHQKAWSFLMISGQNLSYKPLNIFAKSSTFDIWLGSKYISEKLNKICKRYFKYFSETFLLYK